MVWIGILIKIWTDPWILWSGCMIEYHFIYLFIDAGRMSFCLSLWWIYFHVSRSNGVCRSMDVCFSKIIYERFSGINLSNIVLFSSRHHCADDGGGYHWLFGLRRDQFICFKVQPNIFFSPSKIIQVFIQSTFTAVSVIFYSFQQIFLEQLLSYLISFLYPHNLSLQQGDTLSWPSGKTVDSINHSNQLQAIDYYPL